VETANLSRLGLTLSDFDCHYCKPSLFPQNHLLPNPAAASVHISTLLSAYLNSHPGKMTGAKTQTPTGMLLETTSFTLQNGTI